MDLTEGLQDLGYQVLISSLVACLVTTLVSHYIGYAIAPRSYGALKKKYEWNTRVTSTIHAWISVGLAIVSFIKEGKKMYEDVTTEAYYGRLAVAVTIGYFISDLLLVLASLPYKSISSPSSTILHHVTAIVTFGLSFYYRLAYIYCLIFIFTEASTPFVNLRWMLAELKMTSSKLYFLNGILMVLSFFLSRIVLFPFQTYIVMMRISDVYRNNQTIAYAALSGLTIAGFLNHYWFYLMIKGLMKMFKKKK